jgi:hypothetical protein
MRRRRRRQIRKRLRLGCDLEGWDGEREELNRVLWWWES